MYIHVHVYVHVDVHEHIRTLGMYLQTNAAYVYLKALMYLIFFAANLHV